MEIDNPPSMVAASNTTTANKTQTINSVHLDYIHKVAFDTYGRRMATCSGDRFVRVWDLTDHGGEWIMTAAWQAHRGSVTSLCWAHPEFGPLLATCGSDHDAKIWEERSNHSSAVAVAQQQQQQQRSSSSAGALWNLRASLTEARRAVTCLEFAPRHWGLKLAVGAADGCVRVYEAVDIMNLAQWPLAATLQSFEDDNKKLGCTCLSWCRTRFEPPTLVAGGSHLVIYRYSETARAWQPLLQLPPPEMGSVLDVAWAPNVGRRFHYIASAEGDVLRIYKLNRDMNSNKNANETAANDSGKDTTTTNSKPLTLESSQTVTANAWRCQWNVTGTVLATSGDGGVVQMWKANFDGQFECVSKVQGDLSKVVASGSTD